MENVALEDRIRVITEYEMQIGIEKMKSRMRTKPLSRAHRYAKRVAYYGTLEETIAFDIIKKQICTKYGVRKVTDLDWTLYDEVNDYAILLWDLKMAEDNFHYAEDIRYIGWGRDKRHVSWTEWKEYWKEWVKH